MSRAPWSTHWPEPEFREPRLEGLHGRSDVGMLDEPLVGLIDGREELERDLEVSLTQVEIGRPIRVSVGFRPDAEARHVFFRA